MAERPATSSELLAVALAFEDEALVPIPARPVPGPMSELRAIFRFWPLDKALLLCAMAAEEPSTSKRPQLN